MNFILVKFLIFLKENINTRMDYLKTLEEIKGKCAWLSNYGLVTKLINEINAKNMIEIGVAYGFHSEFILNSNSNIEYIGIDPYKGHYDLNDCFAEDVKTFFDAETQDIAFDILHDTVLTKMKPFNDRFKLIRSSFENYKDQIKDDSIDLIFIDGDHTYDGVIEDLKISWDKINKNGGILCGDDINRSSVKNACDDFFKEKNVQYKSESLNNVNYNWTYRFPKI